MQLGYVAVAGAEAASNHDWSLCLENLFLDLYEDRRDVTPVFAVYDYAQLKF
jgi:hypothetical protein